MSFTLKTLLISLVAGSQLTQTAGTQNSVSVSQKVSSEFSYKAEEIHTKLKADPKFKSIKEDDLKLLSLQLQTDLTAKQLHKENIEHIIKGSGLSFGQVQNDLIKIAQDIAIPSNSFQVVSSIKVPVKPKPVSTLALYSEASKVAELIKKSSLKDSLQVPQIDLLSNYFASQISVKKITFGGLQTFCQEKHIEISSIEQNLLSLLKQIGQLIPQVEVNIEDFFKSQVEQPKVLLAIKELNPRIEAKPDITQEQMIKAFYLYLDAKARAEAEAKENEKLKVNLRAIVNFLKIKQEQELLQQLMRQFALMESKVIVVQPQIVIARVVYVRPPPPPTVVVYVPSEYEMQARYEAEFRNWLRGSAEKSYSSINAEIARLDSLYQCNLCKSSSYVLKKEAQIYATNKVETTTVINQLNVSVNINIQSNTQITQNYSSNISNIESSSTTNSVSKSEINSNNTIESKESKDEVKTEKSKDEEKTEKSKDEEKTEKSKDGEKTENSKDGEKTENSKDEAKPKENKSETEEKVEETKEKIDEPKEKIDESKEKVDESKEKVDESKEKVDESKEKVDESKEKVDQSKEEKSETQEANTIGSLEKENKVQGDKVEEPKIEVAPSAGDQKKIRSKRSADILPPPIETVTEPSADANTSDVDAIKLPETDAANSTIAEVKPSTVASNTTQVPAVPNSEISNRFLDDGKEPNQSSIGLNTNDDIQKSTQEVKPEVTDPTQVPSEGHKRSKRSAPVNTDLPETSKLLETSEGKEVQQSAQGDGQETVQKPVDGQEVQQPAQVEQPILPSPQEKNEDAPDTTQVEPLKTPTKIEDPVKPQEITIPASAPSKEEKPAEASTETEKSDEVSNDSEKSTEVINEAEKPAEVSTETEKPAEKTKDKPAEIKKPVKEDLKLKNSTLSGNATKTDTTSSNSVPLPSPSESTEEVKSEGESEDVDNSA